MFAANTADVIQFCWIEGDILRIFAAYRKLPGEALQMAMVMHRMEQLLKHQLSLVPILAKVAWWCNKSMLQPSLHSEVCQGQLAHLRRALTSSPTVHEV